MTTEKTVKEVVKAIREAQATTKPYDSVAQVLRVSGSTAWVHIPGGVTATPAELTLSAKAGDKVNVRVSGGRAWITGNLSSPPTDDEQAIQAKNTASEAVNLAETARQASETALEEAGKAAQAAVDAQESADEAAKAATDAKASADEASDASTAARASAESARTEAAIANAAANHALAGLSTVEKVVDTVNWFAAHKKASTDTTVSPDKTYYSYSAETGTLQSVTPDGTENPQQEGWYELDEAITEYVASHIAETDDGLSVIGLANGYRVLISSGAGAYEAGIFLIDPEGSIKQATTANGLTLRDGTAVVAEFGRNAVRIGKNSRDAVIDFLDGAGQITFGNGSFRIVGAFGENNEMLLSPGNWNMESGNRVILSMRETAENTLGRIDLLAPVINLNAADSMNLEYTDTLSIAGGDADIQVTGMDLNVGSDLNITAANNLSIATEGILVNDELCIDADGKAAKAIADGEGNTIADTYAKKNNGALKWDIGDTTAASHPTVELRASGNSTSKGLAFVFVDASGNTTFRNLINAAGEWTDLVPKTRTVNGKALSENIALSASDVSAVPLGASGSGDLTNLNTALSTGIYRYTATATGVPNNSAGMILILRYNENYVWQVAFPNASTSRIYTRKRSAGTWAEWKAVTTS